MSSGRYRLIACDDIPLPKQRGCGGIISSAERSRRWRLDHPDIHREYARLYYWSHIESERMRGRVKNFLHNRADLDLDGSKTVAGLCSIFTGGE